MLAHVYILASARHGLDGSLRCVQGLVLAELVIDLGAGADLAAAARVRDDQLPHHCQLLRELLGLFRELRGAHSGRAATHPAGSADPGGRRCASS